jgi:hypothetical protein
VRGTRIGSVVLIAILVLLVNAPLVRSVLTDLRLGREGVVGTAEVLDSTEREGGFYLAVDLDPARVVRVDEQAYDEAVAAGEIGTRRLPDETDTALTRVEGQWRSPVAYVVVGALDLALLAGIVLYVRVRPRLRPELVLRAGSDLQPADDGSVLDRVEAQSYVVAGRVDGLPREGADGPEVVLDLGDRRVRVLLDGHRCAVAPGETARVDGVMIA